MMACKAGTQLCICHIMTSQHKPFEGFCKQFQKDDGGPRRHTSLEVPLTTTPKSLRLLADRPEATTRSAEIFATMVETGTLYGVVMFEMLYRYSRTMPAPCEQHHWSALSLQRSLPGSRELCRAVRPSLRGRAPGAQTDWLAGEGSRPGSAAALRQQRTCNGCGRR